MSTPTTLPAAQGRTASLYVRLSKEAGTANLSRDGMLNDLRALADRYGLQVVAEHLDDGISGAVRDRPAFRAWLADAVNLRASHLLTWHADRLTREGVNAAALVLDVVEGKDPESGAVVRRPVRLLDVDGLDSGENGDDSAFRLRFVLDAEIARAERRRIAARNKAASARLREAGRWAGGPVPFGAQVVDNPEGPGKVLEILEDEAEVLRFAFRLILRGDSFISVVRRLNAEGHRPRRAPQWSRRGLAHALTSQTSARLVFTSGEARALREALAPKPREARERKPQRFLGVGGLLVCDSCGASLAVHYSSKSQGGKPRYVCSSGTSGALCPAPVTISADPLDAHLADTYLGMFGPFPLWEPVIVIPAADALDEAERAEAAAQAAMLADPSAETAAALVAARATLEAARALPMEREERLAASGRTMGEEWALRDATGRARLLRDALDAPIRVRRGNPNRGRSAPDFAARLVMPWRGGAGEEFDPAWLDD